MRESSQYLTLKHIVKSLQAIAKPKLVKEFDCPTALQEMKYLVEIIESQLLTRFIRNAG